MFARIRTWHVLVGPLPIAVVTTMLVALVVHFPNVSRRPKCPPQQLFFVLFCGMPILLILFAAVGVRSPNATSWVAFVSATLGWLLTWYGLTFVWVNTFGS